MKQIRIRNATNQPQQAPVAGRPMVAAGSVLDQWVHFTDSMESALARGRFSVVEERVLVQPVKADDEAPDELKKKPRSKTTRKGS